MGKEERMATRLLVLVIGAMLFFWIVEQMRSVSEPPATPSVPDREFLETQMQPSSALSELPPFEKLSFSGGEAEDWDEEESGGGGGGGGSWDLKRRLRPRGIGAYLFVQMGAYRGGRESFSVVGLGSKPLHVYSNAYFNCRWINHDDTRAVDGKAIKFLPDWGFGRVYTTVVVNCSFPAPVGSDASGGKLLVEAFPGIERATESKKFLALVEAPGDYGNAAFRRQPRFEFLHCGSPLYGDLSPLRVREWIAYHAYLFGRNGHFVFHDAGGIHPAVKKVLEPWIRKGIVTVENVTELENFDGYYHNQFLVLNDCLQRHKFSAKWIFFFDLDEFLFVDPKRGLRSVMTEFGSKYSQVTFAEHLVSIDVCLKPNASSSTDSSDWGLDKFVFKQEVKGKEKWERKFALQPRYADATGVHLSEDLAGQTLNTTDDATMRYYHFHGSTSRRSHDCPDVVDKTQIGADGSYAIWGFNYVYDPSLSHVADSVRRYEIQTVGRSLASTPI